MVWLRQLYFSTQLNELKRGKLSYTSWPEREASFQPVHSSCLLTTSNHRHHYQQPEPLITSHPSTKGSWSSHALTATGAQGQWKRLGCNWVFWHWTHWTSELQNELWEDKGDIFVKVAHVLPRQHPLLAKAEPKGQAQNKARTIDTMVFFSKRGSPEPTVLSRETGGAGAARGLGDRADKQIQRSSVSRL